MFHSGELLFWGFVPNGWLRDEFVDHFAVNVGQPEIAAGVTVRQLEVIKTHQMQDGRAGRGSGPCP